MLRRGQVLFTYLHLAPDLEQTRDLIESGATCIAYETVTSPHGGLPLLTPMSEVAGRLAPQVGAHALEKAAGGRGVLLGGVPGVPAAEVVILGGGVSGTHAATIAVGMGANVTVVDRSNEALEAARRAVRRGDPHGLFDPRDDRRARRASADLADRRGAGPGAAAPKLVTRAMLETMRPGAVIVDIAIDQGGCCETSQSDHPRRPDLCGRRRRALLRRQHARRRRAHLDFRAQQRDAAVRARARQQGLAAGASRRPASARGPQRPRWRGDLRTGGLRPRPRLDAGRPCARLKQAPPSEHRNELGSSLRAERSYREAVGRRPARWMASSLRSSQ